MRALFDEDVALYERARPGYPNRWISDLVEVAAIGPNTRVLEIGPGTGQATAAVIALGASVVGVELGAALATVLAQKLADKSVEVVVSAFDLARSRHAR